ncbi:MAG: hypothetical protein ACR2IJ_07785 [Fluviibacter sp.]
MTGLKDILKEVVGFIKNNYLCIMGCIDCTKTKPVLSCVTNLKIGTVGNSTAYYVYFKNSSNGKLNRVSATSNLVGLLTAVIDFDPLANCQYEVWATLQTAEDIDARVVIGISTIETDCFYVQFQRVYNSSNVSITATNQTLALA